MNEALTNAVLRPFNLIVRCLEPFVTGARVARTMRRFSLIREIDGEVHLDQREFLFVGPDTVDHLLERRMAEFPAACASVQRATAHHNQIQNQSQPQ
jgi:hypothetical protein